MKVSQEEKKFTPITIVLETEEEAKTMYAILNCSENEALSDYCDRNGVCFGKSNMYAQFSNIFS